MTQHTLRVTLAQDIPVPRDLSANATRIIDILKSSDADIVVFPELFLSGYQSENLGDLGVDMHHPLISRIAQACRDLNRAVLFGGIELEAGTTYNSYFAIDQDGTILPPVRKTHLFAAERKAFAQGDILQPIQLAGVQVGVINCFELEFPEVARTLALRGAEVFLTGSANMHPFLVDHQAATHARAIESRLPLVYANRVGSESGHSFCGGSRAIDAAGNILLQLDTTSVNTVTVDLLLGAEIPSEARTISQRMPELYEP